MNLKLTIAFLFSFFLFAQNNENKTRNNKKPNDVRWVTQSLEYESICAQTYSLAYIALERQIKSTNRPVIIMDIDETVLDNSQYQVELFLQQKEYNSRSWDKWVLKEAAELVPGAKNFILKYKQNPNSRIIYLSNRNAATLEATKNNMKKLGIYFENDIFLLRENNEDTKVIRRNEVMSGAGRMQKYGPLKILAYFGDAMGDFPLGGGYEFARNKFIFPNPMYGKW